MKHEPNLATNYKKVVNILPEIITTSAFIFVLSLPITIPYFLESQTQPKISVEPIITIPNPNEPQISLNKSVIKIPQSK